jgi:hypothetical protein
MPRLIGRMKTNQIAMVTGVNVRCEESRLFRKNERVFERQQLMTLQLSVRRRVSNVCEKRYEINRV